MPIRKLGHYSVRTSRLEESTRFYVEILGFRVGFRPALDFPGAWLYQGDDNADFGVVHLIGTTGDGDGLAAYLGARNDDQEGTGVIDHLAFVANDVDEFRARLDSRGIDYRERAVKGLGLYQMFFEDPSGLTLELNFPVSETVEASAPPTA